MSRRHPATPPLVIEFGARSDIELRRQLRSAIEQLNGAQLPSKSAVAWVDPNAQPAVYSYRLAELVIQGLLAFGWQGPATYRIGRERQTRMQYFKRVSSASDRAYLLHDGEDRLERPYVIRICSDDGRVEIESRPLNTYGYTAAIPLPPRVFDAYMSGEINQFEFGLDNETGAQGLQLAPSISSTDCLYIQAVFKMTHFAHPHELPTGVFSPVDRRVRTDVRFLLEHETVDPVCHLNDDVAQGWATRSLAGHIGLMHHEARLGVAGHLRRAAMESTSAMGQHFIEKWCDYYSTKTVSKDHSNSIYAHDFRSSDAALTPRASKHRRDFITGTLIH